MIIWNPDLLYVPSFGIGASNMAGQPSPFGLAPSLLSQRWLWSFYVNGAEWRTWLSMQQRNNSFGPELGFGQAFTTAGKRLAYAKFGQSGSSLVEDWAPSSPSGLWAQSKAWWASQRARFPGQFTPNGNLHTSNGYADGANGTIAAQYKPEMLVLIDDWRSIYGEDERIVISRLNIDVTGCPEKLQIWTAQNEIALERPNVFILDTDGLPTSDGVHWTQPSQVTVGVGLGTLAAA